MNISEPQLMVPNDEHSISGKKNLWLSAEHYTLKNFLSFSNAEHIQSSSKTGTSIHWIDKIRTQRAETWRHY